MELRDQLKIRKMKTTVQVMLGDEVFGLAHTVEIELKELEVVQIEEDVAVVNDEGI